MNLHFKSSRRDFAAHVLRAGAGLGLAGLTNLPPFAVRALAEGVGGLAPGRKVLFIFLRGANDALNSCVPILDPAYNATLRPAIRIPPDPGTDYSVAGPCEFPSGATTFSYANAIRTGNGFNALHPSLKFLAPAYNAGELVMVHRVGYPRQSRSHFDSQAYWETGEPNSVAREGVFYRTLYESGVTASNPLAGISIQSSLPTVFKGSQAALTNVGDPTRYDLVGIPRGTGDAKLLAALNRAGQTVFPDKRNRGLLSLQYQNLHASLDVFGAIDFTETGNTFTDPLTGYPCFPTSAAKNGGGTTATSVVAANAYSFFQALKGAALVLNKTSAVIAGTELGGFDTHDNQGGVTGTHADLQKSIAWAVHGLRAYFQNHADQCEWNNLVVMTLSEFGRTSTQNSNAGTDHAEAGLMWVAGGSVKGRGRAGRTSGIIAGSPADARLPWQPGDPAGTSGSMYGVAGRYLQRAVDYRSVLGEIIREHLGASPETLGRIIPGYLNPGEALLAGGTSAVDGTPILGEVDLV